MHSRLSNAPASYLPTKKSQQASQARIAKINELYESMKKHQDSVVSNNSTSVASDDQEKDNCVQIHGLDYNLTNVKHEDEPSVIIKENNTVNMFDLNQTPTPGRHPHRTGVERIHRPFVDDDDDDDDYEAELRFTPKFKSRGSLITMRKSSNPKTGEPLESSITTAPNRARRPSRISSLRRVLGDPLPLPYLEGAGSNYTSPSQRPDRSLTEDSVRRKRQLMERKWRNLIAQDKKLVESKLEKIRQKPSHEVQDESFSSTIPPFSLSASGGALPDSLTSLQKEIIANREKLDHIITLLSQKEIVRPRTFQLQRPSKEVLLWTICIIVLIVCNLYVYYYL